MHLKKWVCTGLTVLLIVGIALMGVGFLLPYRLAETDMPAGQFVLEVQADGTWLLSWPEAENADRYRVELYREGAEEPAFRNFAEGVTTIALPQIPADQTFTLQVSASAEYKTLMGPAIRYGEHPLETRVRFEAPTLTVTALEINGDDKTAALTVEKSADAQWQYTLLNESGSILEEDIPADTAVLFHFGEGSLALPAENEACLLRARAFREEPGFLIYGRPLEDRSITGQSLQFRKLNPVLTETSKNTLSITWDETRGDHYEVQAMENGGWVTLAQVSMEGPRQFTEWVEPGETRQYRIAAADDAGEFPVISETLEFTGRALWQYATVWPTRNLAGLSSPHSGNILEFAKEGQAYCVLDEESGMFAVRINGQVCYIDSNYCLINLPEYLGGLCSYNITNSDRSIYAIHDFPIPQVTGVVTVGYEDIRQEDGSCLVPLLYPTARRLVKAAQIAREQGYRLKIYDSFRPYVATREVYDLTAQVLASPLPEETYYGVPKSTLTLPEPREDQSELTLGWLMTGRNYDLRSFLARDGSAHNLGIAMDLTLEDLATGEEVQMQSRMHDLSHFSVLSENNDMAKVLNGIMLKAGFSELVSEWWHFQDNSAKENLGLNPVVYGVSARCWVKDDIGWKFRTAKGGCYAGETTEIDGQTYTFDENGYVLGE